jgi:hypothetical protein
VANIIAKPIIVDTPGAGLVFSDKIRVVAVKWVAPDAVPGDLAIIKDAKGIERWKSVAPGANFDTGPQRLEDWWISGFSVPTLDHGKLYVYWV